MNDGSPKHLVILLLFLMIGCNDGPSTHPVFRYYPPESVFEDGYVSKYYEHYYPNSSSKKASTKVTYFLYQKTTDDSFVIESYNAGFWLTGRHVYHVDETKLYLDASTSIWRMDTTKVQVDQGLMLDWGVEAIEGAPYQIREKHDTYSFTQQFQQTGSMDTLINDLPAKVFTQTAQRKVVVDDTTTYEWTSRTYFVEGLGYYAVRDTHPEYRWEVELVEQMPVSKFRKLANHGEKRVAYIDPEATLDQGEGFELCGHETFIADYYNSTPDGDYLFGKAALVDSVLSNLDRGKMMNQTGMLTFRFVVNCNGEAGRFIAEGYDLNYQPYEFPEVTVSHLYEQLRRLKEWQPVVIREEPTDAYFYFTFKLNNGEITDILP